jgi:hypothetical protein
MLLARYRHLSIVARQMTRDTALKKRFNNCSGSVQNRPQPLFKNALYPQEAFADAS